MRRNNDLEQQVGHSNKEIKKPTYKLQTKITNLAKTKQKKKLRLEEIIT
jgi:hypothetical protein